jgi:hypothetical protein
MIKILDIQTRYVESSPFAHLIEGTFSPYYVVEISFTDAFLASVKGDRPDHIYVARGSGETEYEAERNALEAIVHNHRLIVAKAYDKWYVDNGAGLLHIA